MKNVLKKEIDKIDKKIRNNVLKHGHEPSTKIDKYLKWTPTLSVFALDALGVKTKNNIGNQLKIIATSEALLTAVIEPLKNTTKKIRPNGSLDFRSFPSNHTATPFLGAEILRQELKEEYPVACYSGYAIAITTGVLRVLKNKHWLSDVVTGAAIGILSAKLTYYLFRKKKKNVE